MERYRVLIKISALKELEDIPQKILRQITRRIQFLSESPRPSGCEKLSGQERYRLRQGDYRIPYEISDKAKSVDVVKVAHRREVYR